MNSSSPLIICLKSSFNNKFLRYQSENVQSHGLLQSAGDQIIDPYAQFEVENSTTYNALVHLKSRFNNKYLVRWSPDHDWITASAIEKDEDKTNWSCTLFRFDFIDIASNKMRLEHVQLGHYVYPRSGGDFDSCLYAGSKEIDTKDSRDVFTYIDWDESLFKYPKKVAFKSEGKFLGPSMVENIPAAYLQFLYDDITDPKIAHEVFVNGDGVLSIKSDHYGKFWRYGSDDWIIADADDPRGAANNVAKPTMFRPNVLDINVVALLNMQNTMYCKRYTSTDVVNGLRASSEFVDEFTPFEVIDLELV